MSPPGPTSFRFDLPSEPRRVGAAVRRALRSWARAGGLDRRARFRARVALGETLANAVVHGNEGDPSRLVRVEGRATPHLLRVSVTDEGSGFEPEGVPDPREAEGRTRAGGRGLLLVRRMVDRVRYEAGGRRVTLWVRGRGSAPVGAGGRPDR